MWLLLRQSAAVAAASAFRPASARLLHLLLQPGRRGRGGGSALFREYIHILPAAACSYHGRASSNPVIYSRSPANYWPDGGGGVLDGQLRRRLLQTSAADAEPDKDAPKKEGEDKEKDKDKKPSSKIEETVNQLRRKQQEKQKQETAAAAPTRVRHPLSALERNVRHVLEEEDALIKSAAAAQAAKLPKKPLLTRIWDVVVHYYSGFKLLFLDVRVSSSIVWRLCQGHTLTRRENKQLVRTVSDLFRLVPFSVFVIIPFMELLLPVALKLFPGMLPSTFTTTSERETKMRRTLRAKLEYAKFLQETLDEMGPVGGETRSSKSARDFVEFFQSVKDKGMEVRNEDILKFSKLFEDEITLDNMTRAQLVALTRLLELAPIGTNNFLRLQLEMKLRKLRTDDKVIQREGVENMDVNELQVACKERGMRALGLSEKILRRQLTQWLDLSLNENIPPSLLLLSRTLYLPDSLPPVTQIRETISTLSESAAAQTSAQIGEREGKIRNVVRLEMIKEEQRKIEEEAAEKEKKEEEDKKKEEEKEKEKAKEAAAAELKDAIIDQAAVEPMSAAVSGSSAATLPTGEPPLTVEDVITAAVPAMKKKSAAVAEATEPVKKATVSRTGEVVKEEEEELVDKAPVLKDKAEVLQEDSGAKADADASLQAEETKKAEADEAKKKKKISTDDLSDLKSAIETLNKSDTEEEKIGDLKQELRDYEDDLEELKFMKAEAQRLDLHESKGARRLFHKVNKMLSKVDELVSKLQEQERQIMEEKEKADAENDRTEEQRTWDAQKLVTVTELLEAVHKLENTPDAKKLEQIGEVLSHMDADADGMIHVDHVLKVIELLGREHVRLSGEQMRQIAEMLHKEDMLAAEEMIEDVLDGARPDADAQKTGSADEDVDADAKADVAKDLSLDQPEQHIREMFEKDSDKSAPAGQKKDGTAGGRPSDKS